jgi:hypothetical protein
LPTTLYEAVERQAADHAALRLEPELALEANGLALSPPSPRAGGEHQ